MGPPQYPPPCGPTQEPSSRFGPRRCLLKGCERLFRPVRPQERYCSAACRDEAAQWRRWRSSRKYRASDGGKQCRREQARRYRERRRQQQSAHLEAAEVREGQRAAPDGQDFSGFACRRPGCYVLVPIEPSVPQRRFCSCPCRLALRRVLDREARWRKRRRQCRPRRSYGHRSRPPPTF